MSRKLALCHLKVLISAFICSMLILPGLLLAAVTHAVPTKKGIIYQNIFMSYYSPQDVKSMVAYEKKLGLGGLIMWEFSGDMPYTNTTYSLLKAANSAYFANGIKVLPQIIGYWTDWGVYSSQAIPESAYPVPGSIDGTSGKTVTNLDFTNKLAGMNVIVYAFLEAQAKTYTYKGKVLVNPNYAKEGGTLYFNDPWSDLKPADPFCASHDKICYYVDHRQGKNPAEATKMGNLEAFANLKHVTSNNPLGQLKKIISIGGYGHNDTYEDAFNSASHMKNFVDSAKAIVDNYKLSGIDLDYENPRMTHAQSNAFANLVKLLREAMPNKIINVTILANPDYIKGVKDGIYGFDPKTNALLNIVNIIASQPQSRINLMTYDFHGAFDYPDGKTGFLTNLYLPNDEDSQDAKFSVNLAVNALHTMGIPYGDMTLGVPAYSRAIANIPEAGHHGLFQKIPANAIVPRGTYDSPSCIQNVAQATCSGSFSYKYIINKMLGYGFQAYEHQDVTGHPNVFNGTTAYALSWTVPLAKANELKIENTGSEQGYYGLTISIHGDNNTFTSGYIGPTKHLDFSGTTTPSTLGISGQKHLTVSYYTYKNGPAGVCQGQLDFTHNMQINIKLQQVNSPKVVCEFKPLSG